MYDKQMYHLQIMGVLFTYYYILLLILLLIILFTFITYFTTITIIFPQHTSSPHKATKSFNEVKGAVSQSSAVLNIL